MSKELSIDSDQVTTVPDNYNKLCRGFVEDYLHINDQGNDFHKSGFEIELSFHTGAVLKRIRRSLNLTIESLSKQSEVSKGLIEDQEIGKKCLELPDLHKVCRILGTTKSIVMMEVESFPKDTETALSDVSSFLTEYKFLEED
jgi:transcriptional regulator with XRE-family HTH domain